MSSPATVRVEKLVPGGDGLGYLGEKAVFVPLSAPGDLLSLKGVRRRRGVLFAGIDRVLEASPERVDPPCPWFGCCGGCQWMHLDYLSQVRWKEDVFRQAMARIGRLRDLPSVRFHRAPDPWKYRHRARLHIRGCEAGFFRRGSNTVVAWERCALLPDALNGIVGRLREWLTGEPAPEALLSCEIALSPVDGTFTLDWVFSRGGRYGAAAARVMDGARDAVDGGEGRLAGQAARYLAGSVMETRGGSLPLETAGVRVAASAGTFFQVNPAVNEILVQSVLTRLRKAGTGSLLDLYCGNGNFSLPAAGQGVRTTGVESSPGAARDALTVSGSSCRFIQGDSTRFLEEVNGGDFEAVIVDPPRKGLSERAASLLSGGRFAALLYVSCEPSTLARDLARLVRGGYTLGDVELFDMFPQTSHLEALVAMSGRHPHGS